LNSLGRSQLDEIVGRYIPLEISNVATGTPVLDWIVPKEWNIRAAYIDRLDGTRIVDFADNNLPALRGDP
jgi:aminopeptidase-like protein